ncbi:MAG TPA: UDP-N-acetylmuramate dehydrogenase [Chitinophagales bacterium]|nr:UDP-N-acetylmuramate dehydrogenase [Chitinophagales bacterium]
MILTNHQLQTLNTFGIAVSAQYFVSIETKETLLQLIATEAFQTSPHLVLGGGSNVLFTENFKGYILHNQLKGITILDHSTESVLVKAMSGENWHSFVEYCIEHNWGGVENLSLIPGTVGAAPIQNIGAYGVEVKDVIQTVEAIDLRTGIHRQFTAKECAFGYRESIFKTQYKNQYFITAVTFRLQPQPQQFELSYAAMRETLQSTNYMGEGCLNVRAVSEAVCHIRRTKLPDPTVLGNGGSFFKNPEVDSIFFAQLQQQYPTIPHYPISPQKIKIPAAWLIEQCGWKGKRVGNAGTHQNHALVLVNYGGATGSEIAAVASLIQASVVQKFNIYIQSEVNIIG